LQARTHITRRLAGDIAEGATERTQAAPPGTKRDVDDRQIGVAQQRGGLLDTPRQEIAMRRQTESRLEGPREMRLRHATHLRQPLHRPNVVRGGVHPVLGAQQAPKEKSIHTHPPRGFLQT
jgi:hypothetical protein